MSLPHSKNIEYNEDNYRSYFSKEPSNGLNVLDLFCGCGGLSLGFKRAGFTIAGGIDSSVPSIDTFNENIGNGRTIDLAEADWVKKAANELNLSSLDVLVGGPPCQGYSLTGTRKFEDERNQLYNSMFQAIEAFSPKVVLIENVRGMATLYGGRAKDQVLQNFEDNGYSAVHTIFDSADFGVPQHRKRLFFLATKLNTPLVWPARTNERDTYITCKDALSDLPSMENNMTDSEGNYKTPPQTTFQELMRQGSLIATNHQPTIHKQFVIDTIKQVPEGGNHKDLPPGVGESRKFNEAWTRYHGDKPSRTIDTGHRNHFHYKFDRVPTVRENARLQSFPDAFLFKGTKTQQYRQVGNAVPVFLAQAIAKSIKSMLADSK